MKKAYIKPSAEKVEFDYTETVTASHWPWCNNNQNQQQTVQQGQNQNEYWKSNPSSSSWWVDPATGVCNK